MSPTPNAKTRAVLMAAIASRRESRQAAYRASRWGSDGQETPGDMVRLEGAERRAFLTNMMSRADAESAGRAPGDLATTVVDAPAMQRALAEEAHNGNG